MQVPNVVHQGKGQHSYGNPCLFRPRVSVPCVILLKDVSVAGARAHGPVENVQKEKEAIFLT